MKRPRKLYIRVSPDIYEQIEAVADSIPALAEMSGVDPGTVRTCIRRYRNGVTKHSIYQEIIIDENE